MKFFVNFFVKPTVFATIKNFIIDLIWSNTSKCPGVDRGSSSSSPYNLGNHFFEVVF